MSSRLKVAVVGGTGETGASIVNALLDSPEKFETSVLVRPTSANKEAVLAYTQRGAIVKTVDLSDITDALTQELVGLDVVVCCLTLAQAKEENVLIEACSAANVGRYIPSFFGPVCPAYGVMALREMKEQNLNAIKRLYLPYTAIDVGWWYQLALPELPSGKLRTKKDVSLNKIVGNGEVPCAFINNRDIGKYVAKIISDPKTLNRMVFCYNEVLTFNEIWDVLAKVSDETIPREQISKQELEDIISRAAETLAKSFDMAAQVDISMGQYMYALGIRGDNTPEHAKYLGYIDARELYPDIKPTSLASYIEGRLSGAIPNVYEGRTDR